MSNECEINSVKFTRKSVNKSEKEKGKFFGDGLTLCFDKNEHEIEINGDGCKLTIETNIGKIRINGDGCRLRIGTNCGVIEYHGDGGRIFLGAESTGTKVDYVGEGGKINIAETRKNRVRRSTSFIGPAERKIHHRSTCDLTRKNHHSDDDMIKCEKIIDGAGNNLRDGRIVRKTWKTVSIVYNETPKISTSTRRCCNNVNIVKSCPVAS